MRLPNYGTPQRSTEVPKKVEIKVRPPKADKRGRERKIKDDRRFVRFY